MQSHLSNIKERLDAAERRAADAVIMEGKLTTAKELLDAAQQRAAVAEQMAIKLAEAEGETDAVAEQMEAQLNSTKLRLDAAEQRAAAAEQMEVELAAVRMRLDVAEQRATAAERMKTQQIFASKTQLYTSEQEMEERVVNYTNQLRAAEERAAVAEQEMVNAKNRVAVAEQHAQQAEQEVQSRANRDDCVGNREVGGSRDKGKERDLGGEGGKASGSGNNQVGVRVRVVVDMLLTIFIRISGQLPFLYSLQGGREGQVLQGIQKSLLFLSRPRSMKWRSRSMGQWVARMTRYEFESALLGTRR
jgi:hypothetical protein